jgi:hypothetical protein
MQEAGMSVPQPDTKQIAEHVLSATFGHPVALASAQSLGTSTRSHVERYAVMDGPAPLPHTVIVKRPTPIAPEVYEPSAAEGPAVSVFSAWASAQFLDSLAPEWLLTPQCYGGDRATGTLVLQDIGTDQRLDQLLLGSDRAAALLGLHQLATTLGRIHALTSGRQEAFDTLRRSFGPRASERPLYTDAFQATFETATTALGITPTPSAVNDLQALLRALTTPGLFEVLTHGDVCPDNCQRVDKHMVLLDFEGGNYGSALLDGVFVRLLFPTCFCVGQIPHQLVDDIIMTYRNEFARGCPAVNDDRLFGRAEVEACAYWTLSLCTWIPIPTLLEQDWVGNARDTGTARQRVITHLYLSMEWPLH